MILCEFIMVNTSYPLLMLYTNTGTIATDTINSYSTGCLTMWFKSNASGVANGWAAAVSCIAGCSNSYEVCKGVSVNWMETAPGSGIGTLNFANLPSTSVEFLYLKRILMAFLLIIMRLGMVV